MGYNGGNVGKWVNGEKGKMVGKWVPIIKMGKWWNNGEKMGTHFQNGVKWVKLCKMGKMGTHFENG